MGLFDGLKKRLGGLRPSNALKAVESPIEDTQLDAAVLPEREPIPVPITGMLTDQKVLQWYYRERCGLDVTAIATDSYISKSSQHYNAPWLAREIVQNFVDHNPENPGTFDGVRLLMNTVDSGPNTFVISGKWPFEDHTGLMTSHSDKPEDIQSAGGNGVGLKQVAIRYLRDFGVDRFEVDGEGWKVKYRLADAESINAEIEKMGYQPALRHSWLIGELSRSQFSGSTQYLIQTDNPDVIESLRTLGDLAVSRANPFLQDLDFENEHGAIKWLPADKVNRGRLFVNGQVFAYQTNGNTSDTYWTGPQYLSLQISNAGYKMSIDRPPLEQFTVRDLLKPMIESMSKQELIEQLKKSEHIWNSVEDSWIARPAAMVVIEELVNQLAVKSFSSQEFDEVFGRNKYLARDKTDYTSEEVEAFNRDGYTLCPRFFTRIGMPAASSRTVKNIASIAKPRDPGDAFAKIAEKFGLEVEYDQYEESRHSAEFFTGMLTRFANQIDRVEKLEGEKPTYQIHFRGDAPDARVLSCPRLNTKRKRQALLHIIRSLVRAGLKRSHISEVVSSHSNCYTSYSFQSYTPATGSERLLIRNTKVDDNIPFCLQFSVDASQEAAADRIFINIEPPKKEVVDEGKKDLADDNNESTTNQSEVNEAKRSEAKEAAAGEKQKFETADAENKAKTADKEPSASDAADKQEKKPGGDGKSASSGTGEEKLKKLKENSLDEKLKKEIPELDSVLQKLDKASAKDEEQEGRVSSLQKVKAWKAAGAGYGLTREDSSYLTGSSLLELLKEYRQAKIDPAEADAPDEKISTVSLSLKRIINKIQRNGHKVTDFEIVLDPTDSQLERLAALRTYNHLVLGVAIPNDFFIYQGKGTKGLNIAQKAIGLHEALFDVSFGEADQVFKHELAHNLVMAHDANFSVVLEGIFTKEAQVLSDIASKLQAGDELSDKEKLILGIRKNWNPELTTEAAA